MQPCQGVPLRPSDSTIELEKPHGTTAVTKASASGSVMNAEIEINGITTSTSITHRFAKRTISSVKNARERVRLLRHHDRRLEMPNVYPSWLLID